MHRHVHLGVIQRSRRQTARARLAYQSCQKCRDQFGNHGDYRAAQEWHLGTVVLLPPGADPKLASPPKFLDAVVRAERRHDAQEGRTLDFTLPRAIPYGLEILVASWIVAPLVRAGMAMQLDVERPPALDGAPNPHVHVFIAQRELLWSGFGKKRREWNKAFRDDNGGAIRQLVLSRIDSACQILGVQEERRPTDTANVENGPEPRIPRALWYSHTRRDVDAIDALRERRREALAARAEAQQPPAEPGPTFIINASPQAAFDPQAEFDRLIKFGALREMRCRQSAPLAEIENEFVRLTLTGRVLQIDVLGSDFPSADIAAVIAGMEWRMTALVGDDQRRLLLKAALTAVKIEAHYATASIALRYIQQQGAALVLRGLSDIDPSKSLAARMAEARMREAQAAPTSAFRQPLPAAFEPPTAPERRALETREAQKRARDELDGGSGFSP